ncbi:MAG: zinc ribbon domain-containing protein [Clostridiales bacterium]|nr:zinc ribbon domain-containing protein [Clostridiales bacterium]
MSELKDTLMKITKTVTKTSSELVKSTKLSMALATEEDKLKGLYYDIGKKVHEIYIYGGSLGKFFDEKYKEIMEAEGKISEIRTQLDFAKGLKSCPKCGKPIDKSAGFCPKCGAKIDSMADYERPVAPQPNASEEAARPAKKTCSACHTENEPGTKFCLRCGRML